MGKAVFPDFRCALRSFRYQTDSHFPKQSARHISLGVIRAALRVLTTLHFPADPFLRCKLQSIFQRGPNGPTGVRVESLCPIDIVVACRNDRRATIVAARRFSPRGAFALDDWILVHVICFVKERAVHFVPVSAARNRGAPEQGVVEARRNVKTMIATALSSKLLRGFQ